MNRMPPSSWSDVATKHDVDLRAEMYTEIAAVRVESAELRASVSQAIEAQTRRTVGFGFALTGLALAAARQSF